MSLDSLVVCQIPDCTTTQAEIELELKTFLSSYCTVCKQARTTSIRHNAYRISLIIFKRFISFINLLF